MSEHSPEPWFVDEHSKGRIWIKHDTPDGATIAIAQDVSTQADARRIVACVNACAGMDDAGLKRVADYVRSCMATVLFQAAQAEGPPTPELMEGIIALLYGVHCKVALLPSPPEPKMGVINSPATDYPERVWRIVEFVTADGIKGHYKTIVNESKVRYTDKRNGKLDHPFYWLNVNDDNGSVLIRDTLPPGEPR